jgi:adenine deaminase
MPSFSIRGNLVDVHQRSIYPATVEVQDGKIHAIRKEGNSPVEETAFIMPGFIDAHIHIESSMLVPSEFARLAVLHGTVATVSDPHEIANVCGIEGVRYMIDNGKTVPFKFFFGAPSCVPATPFETAGAALHATDVESLLDLPDVLYLSEMMNFPGVLQGDEEVLKKIAAAHKREKPVDGHAPGLRGEEARRYIRAGISTDHECFTKEEALDKLAGGMKIIIREGSAAKNFEALADLLHEHPAQMMFCSDDKHPDSLVESHINALCARARKRGIPLFNILQAACVNPVQHYKLPVGLLREGEPADFVVVKNLEEFEIVTTYINGIRVAENGRALFQTSPPTLINRFSCEKKSPEDFVRPAGYKPQPVIGALDGQLITERIAISPSVESGNEVSDPSRDILKIAVINRYENAPAATAFIKNFGLKEGALASTVAHDSHNIVAVGVDDESLCRAVNLVIAHKGGISFVNDNNEIVVPLPIAGLMSTDDGEHVARQYAYIDAAAKKSGVTLTAPYMTLSFMALLVIPHLKLSDRGLFDGDRFVLLK